MKFARYFLVACVFVLVACGPSAEEIAKQIVKEQATLTLAAATSVAAAWTLTPSATFTPLATPTPPPSATPTRTLTPIPTAEPITKGNIIFQDHLTARSGNRWTESGRQEDFYFKDGKYHVALITRSASVNTGSQLYSDPRQSLRLQDFVLEAEVTQVEGDDTADVGVTFRKTLEALYAFEVAPNGTFRVRKNTNVSTDLIKPTPHPAILGRNKPNLLRVVAKGNAFTFYVNDAKVGSVTDNSFTSGTIGVEVSNLDSGGVIHGAFANLNVWALGAPSAGEEFTKGNNLFNDTLSANPQGWTEASKVGWNQGKVVFDYSYHDGQYHVSLVKPHWDAWGSPGNQPNLKDFVLEVQMTVLAGSESESEAFVIFRSANREFYQVYMYGDGSYRAQKFTKGVATSLIPKTSHPIIQRLGSPNKLMIVAKGTAFSIFINDTKVGAFEDTELGAGGISLGAGTDSLKGEGHAAFTNITIWELK